MSTHKICFHGEIRKISILLDREKAPVLELCGPVSNQFNSLSETQQEKMYLILCVPSRLGSAYTFKLSDHYLHCVL